MSHLYDSSLFNLDALFSIQTASFAEVPAQTERYYFGETKAQPANGDAASASFVSNVRSDIADPIHRCLPLNRLLSSQPGRDYLSTNYCLHGHQHLNYGVSTTRKASSAENFHLGSGSDNSSSELGGAKAVRYSAEERKERINRYRRKRAQRNFNRRIKYECRKVLADGRSRIHGRFARNEGVQEKQDATMNQAKQQEHGKDSWVEMNQEDDVLCLLRTAQDVALSLICT